jgi:thiol-disulfide isomerase/thioredoxin
MFNPLLKKTVTAFGFVFISCCGYSQGYAIHLTLKPFANSKVYLGYHYGKVKAVADSVVLDDRAEGVFKGKDKLSGGIYFIVSPKKEILFEVLIDKQQEFSISADSARLPASIVFTGSPENKTFLDYTSFMNSHGKELSALQTRLSTASSKKDSTEIKEKIRKINDEVKTEREEIQTKDPNSLLATLLRALKEPVVPQAPVLANGRPDSSFAYRYYKAHYWDNISYTDDRLIRTPIFEPKLDHYYKDLVSPEPDSLDREIDHMLLFSRTNKDMFKFLLVYFVQKYINPEFMGQDAVFIHLFEKYINTGQADFFTEKYRKFVDDRAYSIMANLIGQPAANLEMTDSSGKTRSLYEIPANFVLLCFWDPTCSHCKETIPKVDSIYQAKWKYEGVQVYAVMVDGGQDNWLNFIRSHNLGDWVNVYQTTAQHDSEQKAGRPDYRQLYDVYQTPVLYLLDKEKRIVAKKLTYQQIDEVINLKLKKVNTP